MSSDEELDLDPVVKVISSGGVPLSDIKVKTARMHTTSHPDERINRWLRRSALRDRCIRELERDIKKLKEELRKLQEED